MLFWQQIFKMIIYNVTVKLDAMIATEWLEYMQEIHIPDVMNTGCFSSYRISRLIENTTEDDSPTYIIQYHCPSMEVFEKYEQNFATDLREDVLKKYKDRFVSFRTLMEEISNSEN